MFISLTGHYSNNHTAYPSPSSSPPSALAAHSPQITYQNQYFGRADELTEFFSHEYALGDGSSAPYTHVIYTSGDPPTRVPVPAPTYA